MKKILLVVAGLLTMVSCGEKEVKQHRNKNEYHSTYTIMEIPGRKPNLLLIEQEDGFISFRMEKNGISVKHMERYNFELLDSNEVKLLIKWVKDDTTDHVISNFKNALMKRLERDRKRVR